jgi:hypothetical protein
VKIINKTQYRTDQISALIRRVAQDELEPGQLAKARVTIIYSRGRSLGNCYYGTMRNPRVWMTLKVPRPPAPLDPVIYAKVIAHELGHAKGFKHADAIMKTNRYGWVDGWKERYAYAAALPIELKPDRPKPAVDEQRQKKLSHSLRMVKRWESKVKRAQTALKKWQRRAKAQEKRATGASAGPAKEGG